MSELLSEILYSAIQSCFDLAEGLLSADLAEPNVRGTGARRSASRARDTATAPVEITTGIQLWRWLVSPSPRLAPPWMFDSTIFGAYSSRVSRIANIGRKGIRRRAVGAIPMLIVTIAGGAYMLMENWPRGLRILLVIPLWFALLSLFQAIEKTCVVLSARGTCDMDQGERPIHDEIALRQIRRQSRRVLLESSLVALVMVGLFWVLVP